MEYSGALLLLCLLFGQGAGELGIRVALFAEGFLLAVGLEPQQDRLEVGIGWVKRGSDRSLGEALIGASYTAEQAAILKVPSGISWVSGERLREANLGPGVVGISQTRVSGRWSFRDGSACSKRGSVMRSGDLVASDEGHGCQPREAGENENGPLQRNLLRRGSSGYGQLLLGVKD